MAGDLLFFAIYLFQQLGVMLGVGATVLLLCTHLVAVHHHEPEHPDGAFSRAARIALGASLALIVLSGLAAIGVHWWVGALEVLSAPAFLFKWMLIVVVAQTFALQGYLGRWSDTLAWFGGGSWFALFLVHTLAPVTSWVTLLALYAGWMAFFAVLWGGFVLVMRGVKTPAPARPDHLPEKVLQAPKPPPPPPPKPVTPPPPPPPPPKPAAPPPPVPVLTLKQIAPPAPALVAPAPVHKPKPLILKIVEEIINIPALRIMPQRPEDVGKHERGPVVSFSADHN